MIKQTQIIRRQQLFKESSFSLVINHFLMLTLNTVEQEFLSKYATL